MNTLIKRVGTTYLPVGDPKTASQWYQEKLGAVEKYLDNEKAILDFAGQSFFLVKAIPGERTGFTTSDGHRHFSMTFEVDGLEALEALRKDLLLKGAETGEIENRGHAGRNFIFHDKDGNAFDVWSELSPSYRGI
ncbi:VOC family protein [Metabacillus indicus]|uniref:VOC family protein n=1 Tax=Metabacillus indicus TaxID=246786 RepID=UPI002A04171B|nr:VOC family protein [Metabacillus indicus]MDX8290419.1 VOC family protein [Metabacillus indicus]